MKKSIRFLFLTLIILSLIVPMENYVFAASYQNEPASVLRGVSEVSVTATRTTSTKAKITASGSLTAAAETIKTIATLYEYNSSTGSLTQTGSPVTKTAANCTSYSFSTTFTVDKAKVYKVKLEITDTTNGKTNKMIVYSNSF
jgi:hypothetical protein